MPHQCPTCDGFGTVRVGNFNPVRVPCTNPDCRAGVIYEEEEENNNNNQTRTPPTSNDIIGYVVLILVVIVVIYFIFNS